MTGAPKLSDNQAHDLLVAAREALGSRTAETARAQTALTAAKRALNILQFALLLAAEKDENRMQGLLAIPISFDLTPEESTRLDHLLDDLGTDQTRDEFAYEALKDALRVR